VNVDPITQTLEPGTTLICPHCGVTVVILKIGDNRDETPTLTCHSTLVPSRPVRCWQVPAQQAGALMVAGALYVDEATGLTVRCTRAGAGLVRCGGREVRHTTPRLPWRRSIVA
jgi:hypothetical protein